jgi:hypothetical protein
MLLDTIKSHRKTIGRACKKLLGLAAELNQAIPGLAADLTNTGLFLDKAEQCLLAAETKLEDARQLFADNPRRPAA